MTRKHRNENKPSMELLRARVAYDPETGALLWKPCDQRFFGGVHGWKVWHGKFAGREISKKSRGYVVITVSVAGKEIYCMGHRAAWALMTGAWPEKEIDHINGDRSDNRWANLREATHQENQWNRGLSVRNQSGFVGVHRIAATGKWRAQILVGGRVVHIGCFDDPEVAAAARQKVAAQHHGEFVNSRG